MSNRGPFYPDDHWQPGRDSAARPDAGDTYGDQGTDQHQGFADRATAAVQLDTGMPHAGPRPGAGDPFPERP